jgi:hypothetical protein
MIHRFGTSRQLTRRITTMPAALALTLLTLLYAWPALAGPAITSVTTASMNVGTPTSTTFGGTNFCPGVRVQLYQPGVGYIGSSYAATYNAATYLSYAMITFTGTAGNYYIGAVDDLGNCGGTQANPTSAIQLKPVITSLSPSSVLVGSATFTLTINGRGFGPGSVIKWNSTVLPATYVSATQLTAQIPSSYLTSPVTASIYASDPSGTVFNTSAFSFPVQSLAPTISSISTLSGNGTPTTTIRVFGSNFLSSGYTTVTANGANLGYITTSNNGTQFDVSLTASNELINGTSTIAVRNSGPGGGTVEAGYAYDGSKFVLSSISPTITTAGTGITLTATGANFPSNATIRWNGADLSTTYVSSTQLTASISSSLVAATGTDTITVYNPNTSSASNALTFTINPSTPAITSLSTTTSPVGSGFSFYVYGTGFTSGSQIYIGASNAWTTYYGPTQLYATYTSTATSDIDIRATPGPLNVTVVNSYNGVSSTSNAATITLVNPTPTLSSLSPTTAPMDSGFILTLTGSSFDTDSVVQWNGSSRHTDFSSSTQLLASIPLSDVQNGGTATITVYNPGPGGGTSSGKSLTISYPVPTLSSSSPSTLPMGSSTSTLTLTGDHFFNVSTVQWNGTALTATYIDATHLSVSVPSSQLTSPGTATITVANPSPGGGASTAFTYVITPVLQVGALTQSGWNVTSTVTWPSSSSISNQSVNCGTTASQVIQGASATCIYSQAGTYTISGTSTVGTVTNVSTPTQSITVPLLTPTGAAFTATIDGRPANPSADTYTLPVPLAVAIALTRPSAVGILDPLDLTKSTLQVQLGTATPVTTSLSQVDALDYTGGSSLSQTGTYTITFMGTTIGGVSFNASTTATLTLSNVTLQVGALSQDGWNVDVPISWPSGTSAIQVNCGTNTTQTFVGASGTCVYSQGGTFSVTGTYHEPYHNAQVTTSPATVTIPILPPSAAALSVTVDGRSANPDADTYTFPVPLAVAVQLSRPTGVGIVDPLDLSRSAVQVQLGDTTPIQNSLSEVDAVDYTAGDSLSQAGTYTITLKGFTVGGASLNASTTVALTLSSVSLQIGSPAQDGWNVDVPISWPSGVNSIHVNCGSEGTQTFVGNSGTCVYDKADTFSVIGTYYEPYHNAQVTTLPATVTIPSIAPAAAAMSTTLNGLQPTTDGSVAPFHFPASLKAAITMTRGDGVGIVDPLDLTNSRLIVSLSGQTPSSTYVQPGDDPLHASASNSLTDPGSYTIQLDARTKGGSPVTASLSLQVASGAPALVIGALSQDGFDVLVPVSWPTDLGGATPINIQCGTASAQLLTDTSGTCRYTKAQTFQVTGTYQSPETGLPTLHTAAQSVTIPLRVPTGATLALTVNGQPASDSIAAYRFPATLKGAITLTLPADAGIVDPLDSSTSKLRVHHPSATTTAAYRVIEGTDPTQTTGTGSLDAPDTYTVTLDGHTMGGHAVTVTQSLAVASASVTPIIGTLTQDGPNVTAAVSWPDGITPISVDCGTNSSQTFTGQSGQCTYNRSGQFQVTGRYIDPEDNQPIAAAPAAVTVPAVTPVNPQIALQVNSQSVTDTAPTYRLPSILTATVNMERPDGIGILDRINTEVSSITITPDNLPSTKYRPSTNTDPLIATATGELRYAGHYTIQFIGKTMTGQQITASAPLLVDVVTATLQADPPVQDGDAVAVHVQWPDGGPVGTIQCGFMSQRLTATGGVCRYTRAGTYQIIGYFADAARGAMVATDPVNVTVPQIEPTTPALTVKSVNSQGFSTDTSGPIPVSVTQQPDSYPVQVQLAFSLQRPEGMGILDSLDLDHSSLTATAVTDGAKPIRLALRRGTDLLTYTAAATLTDFAPAGDTPAQWRYHFSLTGQSFGGTSYQADTELAGPIGATPFTLQVRRGVPQIPYAPATYTYTLNAVSSPTKQEPFTPIWTISTNDQTSQTVQKDRMHVTFDQPGTYQIQLTVTGLFSQSTSWSDTVVVPVLPDAPAASIISSVPRYNRPPAQYRFRPSIPALPDRRERVGTPTWTIDDTSTTAPAAVPTFTTPGDHQVSVNIPTSYGRTIAGAITVTVNPNQPPTGTVDCSKSFYSISLKKYVISCRATATDVDGRVRHLIWKVPELTYERDDVSAISLEQTDPQAITVELHIIDDSAAETVVSTSVDMAGLPRK